VQVTSNKGAKTRFPQGAVGVRADFRCFFSSVWVASWQWKSLDWAEFRDDFVFMMDSSYE
jgi:hypothetical protein